VAVNQTRRILVAMFVLTLAVPAWAQRVAPLSSAMPPAAGAPKHLAVAQALVANLDLANTSYHHGEPQVSFTAPCQSHADCSGFIDSLLQSTYGYTPQDYKKWFDSHRPTAKRYHDAIVDQSGFTQVQHVQDMLPGDLLAVKYLSRSDNTGHIMLAADRPIRISPKAPLVSGTQQWTVQVIDSSESGHGPTDTRHGRGPGGKDHDGVGEGVLRIYSDNEGSIAGFTWSTISSSKIKDPSDEHLVIGRLKPDFHPQ
jgi:hypothetical protein